MNLQPLKEKLEQGFYIRNLREMARLCHDMALESDKPAPFFIMKMIFVGIADHWEQEPVNVEDAKLVQDESVIRIKKLIDALESSVSEEEVMALSNDMVSSYLFLFR